MSTLVNINMPLEPDTVVADELPTIGRIKKRWYNALTLFMLVDIAYVVCGVTIVIVNQGAQYGFIAVWGVNVAIIVGGAVNILQGQYFRGEIFALKTQTRTRQGVKRSEFVNDSQTTAVIHTLNPTVCYACLIVIVMLLAFCFAFYPGLSAGCRAAYPTLWAFSIVTAVYIKYKTIKIFFVAMKILKTSEFRTY